MRQLSGLLLGITATIGVPGCSRAPAPPAATPTGTTQTTTTETEDVAEPTEVVAVRETNGVPAGFESPEAAFAAMTEAIADADIAAAVSCTTAESQEAMAMGMMQFGRLAALGGERAEPLVAVFEKYELDGSQEDSLPEDVPAFLFRG